MTEAAVSTKHESAPRFELNVSLPTDARFAETARELAVHAARHAGCPEAKAHAFGDQVAGAIRAYLETGDAVGTIPLVLRRTTGPVEVVVNGRTLTLDP